jgi:amidohydrolase
MALISELVEWHHELKALRHDIHRHPELAFEEHRTADIVAAELTSYGVELERGIGKTGVVGTLRNGRGNRAIALRADMDALAMQELNDFDHASTEPGKMHGCGHDGHTVMLLATARYFAGNKDFDGTVHFVFQPAEEGMGGAPAMIEDGLFERFPVESVWGLHNFPSVPVGHFITCPGPFLACSDTVRVTVNGRGGHGAMPHFSRSPINAACSMIQALNNFVAQEIDTQIPTTFTVGSIRGGDAINVIPDSVEFAGTMRSFSDAARGQFEAGLERIVTGLAAASDLSADATYSRNYPPLINTSEETERAAKAASRVVGEAQVNARARRIMGSEDFAFMLRERPGNYIMLGNGDGELGCMVHNPHYDFNDDLLPIGASYWVELVKELLPIEK